MVSKQQKLDVKKIKELISLNFDTRQYFFNKADERWLDWLWSNGFLDIVKEKSEDSTQYAYHPEISYLVKVAEKEPKKVANIILDVPISKETFNPEVIDQFLQICSELPASQLARIVPKIEKENWIPLMDATNQWGFMYEKMFTTLSEAKDYSNILTLAKAVLSVRPKEKVKKDGFAGVSTEKPFYFSDLSQTKVFEILNSVDSKNLEEALKITTETMSQVVLLGGKAEDGDVFRIEETFRLYDVDFFDLKLDGKKHLSHRDDVRALAAVIKELVQKTIGSDGIDSQRSKELYKKYLESLADSRSMWRLRLFVLTLQPEHFKVELKDVFFRVFKVDRYHEIISGAEYMKALQKGFSVLENNDKREYITNVIKYFTKHAKDKEDQDWHMGYGSRILSVIPDDQITKDEKLIAKKAGFTIDPNYKPEPSIKMDGFASAVISQSPVTSDEFQKMTIVQIAEKLRKEFSPETLAKKYKVKNNSDYHRPINAEGVGGLLQNDISERFQEYIENAEMFFERGVLDQQYTYSFLRGVDEAIKKNEDVSIKIEWKGLIDLLVKIKESGEKDEFKKEKREREVFDGWLAGWTAVHSAITDVLQTLLNGKDAVIDLPKYRDPIFKIISYLLHYPDPIPKDEDLETAGSKTGTPDGGFIVSDPYSRAINTVRGRAFQAFVLFVYQDGEKSDKTDKVKISSDSKKLYEEVLQNEDTRALMFMFGHYIPSFYFRDIEWMLGLLPQIFPSEPEKKHLYIAAWDGYLANTLYQEIFSDSEFQKLYERGIALTNIEDPERKYFKDPDESLAIHLALAFMHYEEFDFKHPLFKSFWKKDNPDQHADFMSFLGRSFVSGSNTGANDLLEKEPRSKQRLKDMWDWLLENCNKPQPFIEMGFWISLEKNIFEIKWLAEHVRKSLEKTKGTLDWDYGLEKTISHLAKEAPEETLKIARLYLLEGGVHGTNKRFPMHVDKEWRETLEILYKNKTTKSGTYTLIDDLVREGGSAFWGLKDVIKNETPKA